MAATLGTSGHPLRKIKMKNVNLALRHDSELGSLTKQALLPPENVSLDGLASRSRRKRGRMSQTSAQSSQVSSIYEPSQPVPQMDLRRETIQSISPSTQNSNASQDSEEFL